MDPHGRDGVLLLHGIARSSGSMGLMARALRRAGYRTLNLGYPSRSAAVAPLAAGIEPRVTGWAAALAGELHVVTHSMGGLVARALIRRARPENLGRVVMLGPPNQGSELADRWRKRWFFRRLFGPAGDDLVTARGDALIAALGTIDYPLGVIAGRRSIDPLCWALLPRPNDGKVTVASTRVAGMADHIMLPVDHTFMMRDAAVISATLAFLRDGHFPRQRRAPMA